MAIALSRGTVAIAISGGLQQYLLWDLYHDYNIEISAGLYYGYSNI